MSEATDRLRAWLEKQHARELWRVGDAGQTVIAYQVCHRVLIVAYSHRPFGGFDVYVPASDSLSVDVTLAAVEKALGL